MNTSQRTHSNSSGITKSRKIVSNFFSFSLHWEWKQREVQRRFNFGIWHKQYFFMISMLLETWLVPCETFSKTCRGMVQNNYFKFSEYTSCSLCLCKIDFRNTSKGPNKIRGRTLNSIFILVIDFLPWMKLSIFSIKHLFLHLLLDILLSKI